MAKRVEKCLDIFRNEANFGQWNSCFRTLRQESVQVLDDVGQLRHQHRKIEQQLGAHSLAQEELRQAVADCSAEITKFRFGNGKNSFFRISLLGFVFFLLI